MKPIIGLDLDGVIRHNNKSLGTGDISIEYRTKAKLKELYDTGQLPRCYYCTKPEDIIFIDGALEALKMFRDMNWECYVISNQEAVGVGVMTEFELVTLIQHMDKAIGAAGGKISDWFWCPHEPTRGCECRKPKPGLFHKLEEWDDVPLHEMYYIGDNPSDMEAGKRAGCKTIHIINPLAESEFQHSDFADERCGSLLEAAEVLVGRHGG